MPCKANGVSDFNVTPQADKISGFLKQQKSRTTAATGKSEWLIVHQQQQDERSVATLLLSSAMRPMPVIQ